MYVFFSLALQNGDVQLLRGEDPLKLVVTVCMQTGGPGQDKKADWTLQQPSATQLKTEMKSFLFSLWENLCATKAKLQGSKCIVGP